MLQFRWNEWNIEHLAEHGVSPEEAEYVIRNAKPPYPEYRGDDKWRVIGATEVGRFLHVVYVLDDDEDDDEADDAVFVIHARDATDAEKRRLRRRRR
jgi:uncharacterized protein